MGLKESRIKSQISNELQNIKKNGINRETDKKIYKLLAKYPKTNIQYLDNDLNLTKE